MSPPAVMRRSPRPVLTRLAHLLISLVVLAGTMLGFALAADAPGQVLGFGLAGGVGMALLLFGLLRALPLRRAWQRAALSLGLPLAVLAALLLFWTVPMVRAGLALNAEPLVLKVDDITTASFDVPRYVDLSATFDEALATDKTTQVQTRNSNNSAYRSETRRHCRWPALPADPARKTVLVATDQCAPYTVRPARYPQRFTGILYPACRNAAADCATRWQTYADGKTPALEAAGFVLDTDKGYVLRVGESPRRTYLSAPAFGAVFVLIWIALVLNLAVFAVPPRERLRRSPARAGAPSAVTPEPASSQPSPAAMAPSATGPARAQDAACVAEPPGSVPGPGQRLEAALQDNPATHEVLDLRADWDSYKREPPLTRLPTSIGSLATLKSLDLTWNSLSGLPAELAGLVRLEELRLAGNPLQHWPDVVLSLPRLRLLDVEGCSLDALPAGLGRLGQLQTLLAADNRLAALPASIGELRALRHLDLARNRLQVMPEGVLDLSELQFLNLADNRLVRLPEAAAPHWSRLETLWLSGNTLSSWPPWLCHLASLQTLHFGPTGRHGRDGNALQSIPQGVSGLHRLVTLSVSLGADATISEAWADLPGLSELRVGAPNLPPEVTWPRTLKSLSLLGLWAQDRPLAANWSRLDRLRALEVELPSAALLPDAALAIRSLKTLKLRCDKINQHQQDRLARLKPPACKVEIVLSKSGRRIELS